MKSRAEVKFQFGDGSVITEWQSFEWRDTYIDPLGQLTLTLHPPRDKRSEYRDKTKKGELLTLFIDGHPQITALITRRRRRVNRQGGTEYQVTARSVLATCFEGCVDSNLARNLTADTAVGAIVLEALAPYGFEKIVPDTTADVSAKTGKSLSGRKPAIVVDELKDKDAQAQPGESAYAFCRRMFSRFGLALRVNVEGVLLLGSPDFDQDSLYALHEAREPHQGSTRMMGEIAITETNENQFSHCAVEGRGPDKRGATSATNPVAGVRWQGTEVKGFGEKLSFEDFPVGPHSYASSVAPHKPLFKSDKRARDVDRAKNWASRLLCGSAENAFVIECMVPGLLAHNGAVWTVDTIADVLIEDEEIDDQFWILETTKRGDRSGGQSTSLVLIPRFSLVLSAEP